MTDPFTSAAGRCCKRALSGTMKNPAEKPSAANSPAALQNVQPRLAGGELNHGGLVDADRDDEIRLAGRHLKRRQAKRR